MSIFVFQLPVTSHIPRSRINKGFPTIVAFLHYPRGRRDRRARKAIPARPARRAQLAPRARQGRRVTPVRKARRARRAYRANRDRRARPDPPAQMARALIRAQRTAVLPVRKPILTPRSRRSRVTSAIPPSTSRRRSERRGTASRANSPAPRASSSDSMLTGTPWPWLRP